MVKNTMSYNSYNSRLFIALIDPKQQYVCFVFASEWPNARWYVQESNALGWKTITAFSSVYFFTLLTVMDKWKTMHHMDFGLHDMMAYHNSLSSCPYTCPRCAIKQLNQVETDFMIQKEQMDLQEVMARRPGKSFG